MMMRMLLGSISVKNNKVFIECKNSLEDYQSQTGDRITKKLIRDVVRTHLIGNEGFLALCSDLEKVFIR